MGQAYTKSAKSGSLGLGNVPVVELNQVQQAIRGSGEPGSGDVSGLGGTGPECISLKKKKTQQNHPLGKTKCTF